MRPLLSIVIPTKNRYKYLFVLLQLLKTFSKKYVEVVIQDNSDNNQKILEYIRKEGLPDNFVYSYYAESISVAQNSDYALLNSHGEYICLIGDDDGVTIQIIDIVKIIKEMEIESAIFPPTIYNWPDYLDNSIFELSSTLLYNKNLHFKYKKLSPRNELNDVIRHSFKNLGMMPKVYQGIVKRESLDKLYNKVGTYFPGASPDMANAVALSTIIKQHVFFNIPVIISGQSRYVGGGERLNKKLPKIEDLTNTFLPRQLVNQWNKLIPNLWCSDTIWPQSGIYALEKMDINLADRINYDSILSYFLLHHIQYYNDFIYLSRNKYSVLYKLIFLKIYSTTNSIILRISFLLSARKKIKNIKLIRKIYNITDAATILSEITPPILFHHKNK
jgi:glycosyltransferase involved in cell wall biosynthesis